MSENQNKTQVFAFDRIRKVNFGTDVCVSFLDAVRKVDPSIIGVDTYMKEPVQAVKRFALEKIALLGAEGSNHA